MHGAIVNLARGGETQHCSLQDLDLSPDSPTYKPFQS
jgi:hypothetical protein